MSNSFDKVADVAAHYDELAERHGDHRLAVGWVVAAQPAHELHAVD